MSGQRVLRGMRQSISCQHGYTMLEVVLVLGIIAAFAGMTLPSVLRMFNQQKLTQWSERVRDAVASARIRAIESGLIYQFCCEPNGTHFVVVPFEPDHANSRDGSSGVSGGLSGRSFGVLPKGLSFGSPVFGVNPLATGSNTASVGTAVVVPTAGSNRLSANALQGLPNAGELSSVNWAAPILFNPDGAASADAELVVKDDRAQQVRLRVRAFTGAVSMERMSESSR